MERKFSKFSAKPEFDLQWVVKKEIFPKVRQNGFSFLGSEVRTEKFLNLRQNGSLLTKCQL